MSATEGKDDMRGKDPSTPVGHVPVDLTVYHIANLPLQALDERVLMLTIHLFHDYLASTTVSGGGGGSSRTGLASALSPSNVSTVCRCSIRVSRKIHDGADEADKESSRRLGVQTLLENCRATFPVSLNRKKCIFRLTVAHVYISRRTGEECSEPLSVVDFGFHLRTLLHEKTRPFLIGTPVGQVGLSFFVSESDTEGYRNRLTSFVEQHCPALKRRIPEIVQTATELECFGRLYRKFHVMDFVERVEYFFYLYRLGTEDEARAVLDKWVGNELALLGRLVVEHGPEPRDIPRSLRTRAFAEAHSLVANTIAVDGTWEAFSMMMAELVLRYGPEPHPQEYLFPEVMTAVPLSADAAVPDNSRSRLRELHRAQFPTDPDDPENYRHLRFDERTSVYIAQQRSKSSPWPLNKEQEIIERAQRKTSSFAYDALAALEAKPTLKIPTLREQQEREAAHEKFLSTVVVRHYSVQDLQQHLIDVVSAERAHRESVAGSEAAARLSLMSLYRTQRDLFAAELSGRQSITAAETEGRKAAAEQLRAAEAGEAVNPLELRKRIVAAQASSQNRAHSLASPPPPLLPPSSAASSRPPFIEEWSSVVVPPRTVATLPPLTASIGLQLPSVPSAMTPTAAVSSATPSSELRGDGSIGHWTALCDLLNIHHIPYEALFYLSDQRFASLCFELGMKPEEADVFSKERHRKIYGGTKLEFIAPSAMPGKDIIDRCLRLLHAPPVLFSFISVGSVFNSTHSDIFQRRVDAAVELVVPSTATTLESVNLGQQTKNDLAGGNATRRSKERSVVRRCFLVLSYSSAMQTIFFGLQCTGTPIRFFTSFYDAYASFRSGEDSTAPCAEEDISKMIQLIEIGAADRIAKPASTTAMRAPKAAAALSSDRDRKLSDETTILICDVIAGNVIELAGDAPVQLPVEFDAALSRSGKSGEALVVYNPRSVLPLEWLTCSVDLRAVACVNHPEIRAVPLPHQSASVQPPLSLCPECLAARVSAELTDDSTRLLRNRHEPPPSPPAAALDFPIRLSKASDASAALPVASSEAPHGYRNRDNQRQKSPSPTPPAPLRQSYQRADPMQVALDTASMMRTAWGLYRQGDVKGAAAQWNTIFQLYPATAEGREALGIVAEVCEGRYEEAYSLYQCALEANPYSCSALYRCANILETRLGDLEAAEELFERCAALGDEGGARRAGLLRSRLAGGQPRETIELREDLVTPTRRYPSSFAHNSRQRSRGGAGRGSAE
jgi:hypothetical protein